MKILLGAGEVRLIGVAVVAGVYLLFLLIRAIVNHVKTKNWEREQQLRQYLDQQKNQSGGQTVVMGAPYAPQNPNQSPEQLRQQFPNGVPSFYRPKAKDVPAALWVVIVCAFLGALLAILIGAAIIAEDPKGFGLLGGVVVIVLGIIMGIIGVGLRRLKKTAGKWGVGILILLHVAGFISMMVVLAQSGLAAFFMLIPLLIVALLLWALLANMKYLY